MAQWKTLQISRRGIALDPHTGDCFRLNPTASMILASMQQGSTDENIVNQLVQNYGISHLEALDDIFDFKSKLFALGLIA